MAGRKTPQSPPKTGLLTDELKPGRAACFTNRTLFSAETNLHMVRDGVESCWPVDSPCVHQLGPYGWITDVLLSGFAARRHNGEIYIYRSASELGDTPWNWS